MPGHHEVIDSRHTTVTCQDGYGNFAAGPSHSNICLQEFQLVQLRRGVAHPDSLIVPKPVMNVRSVSINHPQFHPPSLFIDMDLLISRVVYLSRGVGCISTRKLAWFLRWCYLQKCFPYPKRPFRHGWGVASWMVMNHTWKAIPGTPQTVISDTSLIGTEGQLDKPPPDSQWTANSMVKGWFSQQE